MNTFTEPATQGLPPPRKTDETVSFVTIPKDHTVIVGGLNQQSVGNETEGFPLLEKGPVLKYLGETVTNMSSSLSLFVFLWPVVLRDDKFRHLQAISESTSFEQKSAPIFHAASHY